MTIQDLLKIPGVVLNQASDFDPAVTPWFNREGENHVILKHQIYGERAYPRCFGAVERRKGVRCTSRACSEILGFPVCQTHENSLTCRVASIMTADNRITTARSSNPVKAIREQNFAHAITLLQGLPVDEAAILLTQRGVFRGLLRDQRVAAQAIERALSA